MRKILGKIVSIRNRIIRRLFIILQCKLKRIDLKIGNKVSFNQQAVINGKGSVIIGDKVSIGYKLGGNYYKNRSEFQPRYKDAVIEIGDEVAFNNNIFICCAQRVKIGNNCLVGEGVTILDFEAHGTSPYNRHKLGNKKEVIIGNNVWIGSKVIIL